ncbi:hypothetical protein ANABIO32_00450 [Rossellomorea marisflavi]|nr:hypothetical protein ANABIO32_00450 [Rossellomorea marisflavi]
MEGDFLTGCKKCLKSVIITLVNDDPKWKENAYCDSCLFELLKASSKINCKG